MNLTDISSIAARSINLDEQAMPADELFISSRRLTRSSISSNNVFNPITNTVDMSGTSVSEQSAHLAPSNRRFMSRVSLPAKSVESEVKVSSVRKTTAIKTHASGTTELAGPRSASESSSKSTLGDRSSGYETPGTSALTTPAETILKAPGTSVEAEDVSARPKVNAAVRAQELRQSRYALNASSKRKWEEDSEEEIEESPDARMARKLQAQMLAEALSLETSTPTISVRARNRRSKSSKENVLVTKNRTYTLISDSSGLSSPASLDTEMESMDDSEFLTTPNRITRSSGRSRAAKDSAKKSIAASSSAVIEIDDSDDGGMEIIDVSSDEYQAEDANDSENDRGSSDHEGDEPTIVSVQSVVTPATTSRLSSRMQRIARRTARLQTASTVSRRVDAAITSRRHRRSNLRRHLPPWRRPNMTRVSFWTASSAGRGNTRVDHELGGG